MLAASVILSSTCYRETITVNSRAARMDFLFKILIAVTISKPLTSMLVCTTNAAKAFESVQGPDLRMCSSIKYKYYVTQWGAVLH